MATQTTGTKLTIMVPFRGVIEGVSLCVPRTISRLNHQPSRCPSKSGTGAGRRGPDRYAAGNEPANTLAGWELTKALTKPPSQWRGP